MSILMAFFNRNMPFQERHDFLVSSNYTFRVSLDFDEYCQVPLYKSTCIPFVYDLTRFIFPFIENKNDRIGWQDDKITNCKCA